jgi:NADH-quinone oxidoreductase subunit L
MTIPLIILGIGSIFTGIGLLFWGNIQTWLEPVTGFETRELAIPAIVLEGITLVVVLVGAAVAIAMYRRSVAVEAPKGNVLVRAARNSMYDDAINDTIAVRPTYWLSRSLVWADRSVIDGIVGGSAAFVGGLSGRMRRLQSGFARSYALAMLGGAILVVVVMLLVRLP